MKKSDFKLTLYRAKSTVFTLNEIALLTQETNRNTLKSKIHYYVKKGVIEQVRRGIYVKPDYDKFELATKIYTPSYISLETVLQQSGVIFQLYEKIFSVSYLSRAISVDGHELVYKKIQSGILLNHSGIIQKENCAIATTERAICDCLYLYGDYHFDNLDNVKKENAFNIALIYGNRELIRRIKKIFGS
jgi:predicted transcriptional regulator of viral defense system